MIRLYPDNQPNAAAPTKLIRLYSDIPPASTAQKYATDITPSLPVTSINTGGTTTPSISTDTEAGNIITAPIQHPITALGGVEKGVADFTFNVSKGIAGLIGADKAQKYIADNQQAVNEIFNSNLKDHSAKIAGMVGEFVGAQIPYILGGIGATELGVKAAIPLLAAKGGGLTLATASKIGTLAKLASNAVGFAGLHQLSFTPEEGSRGKVAVQDLMVLGVLEGIGAGLRAYANSKAATNVRTFLERVKTEKPPLNDIETGLAKIKADIQVETGKTPQELITQGVQQAPKLKATPTIPKELQPLATEARKYKSAEVNILRNAIVNKTIKPTDQVAVFHGTPYWEDIISSNKGIQSGIRRNTPSALGDRVYVSDNIDNALGFSQDQPIAFKLKTAYGDLKPDITTVKNISSTGKAIKNTTEESILKGGAATLSKDTFGIESVIVKRPDGSYVELPYKGGSQELIDKIKSVKQGIPKELESMAKIARESRTHDDFISKFKADELGNFCINL